MTTTLEQLGYTAGGSLAVGALALAAFGCAVRARSTYIAPRCTARPANTIYNPRPDNPQQKRGGAWLGWISYCNSLTYDTLLRGVPGTGTRNGGLEGIMLKVNMDGIVLLRFQALCLKIVMLICVLCLVIILPINVTARCTYEESPGDPVSCLSSNQTNYEKTTLAHIPDLANTTNTMEYVFAGSRAGTLGRLYGIVLCTWVFTYFACRQMRIEWKTLLALRRVYYLETDHWGERRRELENSLLKSHTCKDDEDPESHLNKREPWIPHPEQRETTVNIGLYSVLVGGLPAMPQEEIDMEDVEAAIGLADKKKLDWQLEFATKYFDACVPNPPGYSSSVAAITILPSASDLANAWGKWYAAAGQLRRLRFIRETIQEKVHYDINEDESDQEEENDEEDGPGNPICDDNGVVLITPTNATTEDSRRDHSSLRRKKTIDREIFRDSSENRDYYRRVLGVGADHEDDLLSYDFGPEQTAMYSREFAQGASNCCPNGCAEGRVKRATIDELREMEKEALAKVHAANILLDKAQFRAIEDKQGLIGEAKTKRTSDQTLSKNGLSPDRSKSSGLLSERGDSLGESTNLDEMFGLFGNMKGKVRRISQRKLEAAEHEVETTDDDADWVDSTTYHWEIFQNILKDDKPHGSGLKASQQSTARTSRFPALLNVLSKKTSKAIEEVHEASEGISSKLRSEVKDTFADHLTRESTYAVVTFLSRQAAVAARQCLADGRGQNRWVTFSAVPVPPLADAAPFNIFFCRGCCRPVSISIHQRQKTARKYFALSLLVIIYVFYTIPLQYATSLLDPSTLDQIFDGYSEWLQSTQWFSTVLSGLLSGVMTTIFFSLCPVMFKAISNIGSLATSQYAAEYNAMQYFWWFYVVTAIWGNSLSTIVLNAFKEGDGGKNIQQDAIDIIRQIADTIPTQISATWINWIIVRTLIVMPLHYLLQMNAFMFRMIGWKCCSRVVRGGGPGGPTPYRLYIDGGLVFLCAAALAPASPLLAPCSLLYFLLCGPLIKRNLVFIYRPNYDAGGARWPFLFDILMSSLFVGQIMLTAMMVLKRAFGPAFLAILPFFPCYFFRLNMLSTFLRAYQDASLFHTSELDGLLPEKHTSRDLRESFRRFLVDAHKAAYVPVCLARGPDQGDKVGQGSTYILTSEPSIALGHENDVDLTGDTPTNLPMDQRFFASPPRPVLLGQNSLSHSLRLSSGDPKERPYTQYGVSMRRVNNARADYASSSQRPLTFNDDGSVTSGMHYNLQSFDLDSSSKHD